MTVDFGTTRTLLNDFGSVLEGPGAQRYPPDPQNCTKIDGQVMQCDQVLLIAGKAQHNIWSSLQADIHLRML